MNSGIRLSISICAWIAYLVSYNLYVWNLNNPTILPETKKLWDIYTIGGILTFYAIDGWKEYKSFMHEAIAKAIILTVIANFILKAIIHHGFMLDNPILKVCVYQLIWLTISTMILISSWKNGLFKKQ